MRQRATTMLSPRIWLVVMLVKLQQFLAVNTQNLTEVPTSHPTDSPFTPNPSTSPTVPSNNVGTPDISSCVVGTDLENFCTVRLEKYLAQYTTLNCNQYINLTETLRFGGNGCPLHQICPAQCPICVDSDNSGLSTNAGVLSCPGAVSYCTNPKFEVGLGIRCPITCDTCAENGQHIEKAVDYVTTINCTRNCELDVCISISTANKTIGNTPWQSWASPVYYQLFLNTGEYRIESCFGLDVTPVFYPGTYLENVATEFVASCNTSFGLDNDTMISQQCSLDLLTPNNNMCGGNVSLPHWFEIDVAESGWFTLVVENNFDICGVRNIDNSVDNTHTLQLRRHTITTAPTIHPTYSPLTRRPSPSPTIPSTDVGASSGDDEVLDFATIFGLVFGGVFICGLLFNYVWVFTSWCGDHNPRSKYGPARVKRAKREGPERINLSFDEDPQIGVNFAGSMSEVASTQGVAFRAKDQFKKTQHGSTRPRSTIDTLVNVNPSAKENPNANANAYGSRATTRLPAPPSPIPPPRTPPRRLEEVELEPLLTEASTEKNHLYSSLAAENAEVNEILYDTVEFEDDDGQVQQIEQVIPTPSDYASAQSVLSRQSQHQSQRRAIANPYEQGGGMSNYWQLATQSAPSSAKSTLNAESGRQSKQSLTVHSTPEFAAALLSKSEARGSHQQGRDRSSSSPMNARKLQQQRQQSSLHTFAQRADQNNNQKGDRPRTHTMFSQISEDDGQWAGDETLERPKKDGLTPDERLRGVFVPAASVKFTSDKPTKQFDIGHDYDRVDAHLTSDPNIEVVGTSLLTDDVDDPPPLLPARDDADHDNEYINTEGGVNSTADSNPPDVKGGEVDSSTSNREYINTLGADPNATSDYIHTDINGGDGKTTTANEYINTEGADVNQVTDMATVSNPFFTGSETTIAVTDGDVAVDINTATDNNGNVDANTGSNDEVICGVAVDESQTSDDEQYMNSHHVLKPGLSIDVTNFDNLETESNEPVNSEKDNHSDNHNDNDSEIDNENENDNDNDHDNDHDSKYLGEDISRGPLNRRLTERVPGAPKHNHHEGAGMEFDSFDESTATTTPATTTTTTTADDDIATNSAFNKNINRHETKRGKSLGINEGRRDSTTDVVVLSPSWDNAFAEDGDSTVDVKVLERLASNDSSTDISPKVLTWKGSSPEDGSTVDGKALEPKSADPIETISEVNEGNTDSTTDVVVLSPSWDNAFAEDSDSTVDGKVLEHSASNVSSTDINPKVLTWNGSSPEVGDNDSTVDGKALESKSVDPIEIVSETNEGNTDSTTDVVDLSPSWDNAFADDADSTVDGKVLEPKSADPIETDYGRLSNDSSSDDSHLEAVDVGVDVDAGVDGDAVSERNITQEDKPTLRQTMTVESNYVDGDYVGGGSEVDAGSGVTNSNSDSNSALNSALPEAEDATLTNEREDEKVEEQIEPDDEEEYAIARPIAPPGVVVSDPQQHQHHQQPSPPPTTTDDLTNDTAVSSATVLEPPSNDDKYAFAMSAPRPPIPNSNSDDNSDDNSDAHQERTEDDVVTKRNQTNAVAGSSEETKQQKEPQTDEETKQDEHEPEASPDLLQSDTSPSMSETPLPSDPETDTISLDREEEDILTQSF